jgi:hypothetical protein
VGPSMGDDHQCQPRRKCQKYVQKLKK